MLEAARAQDEDRRRRVAPDAADERRAVAVRQAEVEQDQVGPVGVPRAERLGDRSGLGDAVAVAAEVATDRRPGRLVVLDEEHVRADAGSVAAGRRAVGRCVGGSSAGPGGSSPRLGGSPATGIVTTTRSPPSGLDSAATLPPIASVRPRTTASPMPIPRRDPSPDRSTRKNLSKSRSRSSGGTPGPGVVDRQLDAPAVQAVPCAPTRRPPPGAGACRAAFSTRFETIGVEEDRVAGDRRQVVGQIDPDVTISERWPETLDDRLDDVAQVERHEVRPEAAGLDAAEVEHVARRGGRAGSPRSR